ncbi:TBC1 domain family member 2B-like [Lytechinus variegatus]|uniref:TBC1 domain family member 2B-like n=1 Tax=Lytechinus variegatus TaxID=7654 RepID=UPI001BB291C5|nr:TBC1 domain family member 2B-like [Lytechinus variegatus]
MADEYDPFDVAVYRFVLKLEMKGKMAAPWGKEVSSSGGRGNKLATENSPSASLANIPTGVLISFDDDVMPVPPRRNKSLGKKSKMERGSEPNKIEQGALLSFANPELPDDPAAKDSPGEAAAGTDRAEESFDGSDGMSSAVIAEKSSCGATEMEQDFSKEGNTNTCRSELRHNSTSSEDQNNSVKLCGYLDKQGEKGLIKSFKTRWFVFDDQRCRLYYYRTPQDVTPLGSIDVANSSLTFDVANPGSHRQFQIHTDGRTYILQCKDQHTMMFWLQELQERRRAYSSQKTSLSKERSLTRYSVLQPSSGLLSTQKMKEKMNISCPDSDIPPVLDYVEPPRHSVGEATANTTQKTGMFNLSLTSIKTDFRNQMSNFSMKWKMQSPNSETPPDDFAGETSQTDAAKQAEQNKHKSFDKKDVITAVGGAKAAFKKKLSNSSVGGPASGSTKPPSTTWFEDVPDYDCKNCQQLAAEVKQLREELCQVRRELNESKELIDLLHKQLTATQMQSMSNREFSLCQTDQEKLHVVQRKDKQLIQLEQLLQEMRQDRDSFKIQLSSCEREVRDLREQINMFTDLIQAKDEVVMSLTMRVNELERNEPIVVKTETDQQPESPSEIEGNVNLAGNTPTEVVEHTLLNTQSYVDPLEYECLKDSARAFETQNKFLNKEILELNQLRNDAITREKLLLEKYIYLEADYCKTESKYLLLLNEVRGPQREKDSTESDDIISKLIAEAIETDIGEERIKSCTETAKEQLYDKYGFIKPPSTEIEEDNALLSQADKLQRRSDELKSKHSTAEVSRAVKWENYVVAHPEKELTMTPELKSLIRGGIPHEYRARIWKWCVDLRVRKDKETTGLGYYQRLQNSKSFKSSPATKQIELDLLRTLPTNRHYEKMESQGVPKLRRVLLAYSVHNPAIGYCQGLNRVAAIALLYLEEEDAFWCLIAIVEYIMPMDYYSKTLIGSQTDQRVFRELLAEKIPRLHAHFEEYSIDLSLVTFNWFVTCFCDNIPAETMLRIWDTFLSEGNKVLFRFSLAAFKFFEEEMLKQNDYLRIFAFLRRMPEMLTDVQRLTQIAFDELNPFPRRHINNKRTIHRAHVKQQLDELEAIRAEFVPRHSQNGDELASDEEEDYDQVEALLTGTT